WRKASLAGTVCSPSKATALSEKYSRNACFQPTTSARAAKRCSVRTMSVRAAFCARAGGAHTTSARATVVRTHPRARWRFGGQVPIMDLLYDDFVRSGNRLLRRIPRDDASVHDFERLHVVPGFLEGRNGAAVAIDGSLPCVVGRERELFVAVVAVEQLPEVSAA